MKPFPFVSVADAVKMPFRRIYLTWALALGIGFVLSGMAVGMGYKHWILLSVVAFAVQYKAAPWGNATHRRMFVSWALLVGAGLIYTALIFSSTIAYPSFIPHIGTAWLLLLGIGQIGMGKTSRIRVDMIIGILWTALALIFWTPSYPDQTVFNALAIITAVPYLWVAFYRGKA